MIKNIFLAGFWLIITSNVCSQPIRPTQENKEIQKNLVPEKVKDSFRKENPRIRVNAWYTRMTYTGGWDWASGNSQYYYSPPYYDLDQPEYYETDYTKDGKKYRIIYDRYGNKVQTSIIVSDAEIPKAIFEKLQSGEYKDWMKMPHKEMVIRGDVKMYKIRVQKVNKKHILFFNPEGKIVQKKKRDEDFHAKMIPKRDNK
jgi:hypothetical protein